MGEVVGVARLRADIEAAANPDIRDNDKTLAAMARLLRAVPALVDIVEMLARQPERNLLTPNGALCVICGRGPYAFPEQRHAETCAWAMSRKLTGGVACFCGCANVKPGDVTHDSYCMCPCHGRAGGGV